MNPFDFVNAISFTKKDLFADPQNEKQYVPFIVNRAFSYHLDTILVSNEMNMHYNVDKKMQFAFLINMIKPKRRFAKWVKKVKDDDIEAIEQYYHLNRKKAEEAVKLLTADQIKFIKKQLKGIENE